MRSCGWLILTTTTNLFPTDGKWQPFFSSITISIEYVLTRYIPWFHQFIPFELRSIILIVLLMYEGSSPRTVSLWNTLPCVCFWVGGRCEITIARWFTPLSWKHCGSTREFGRKSRYLHSSSRAGTEQRYIVSNCKLVDPKIPSVEFWISQHLMYFLYYLVYCIMLLFLL